MDSKIIGGKIKRFRKRQGLTQDHLADYLGLDRSTISLIEKGERTIDMDKLEKLANLFGVELSVFFSDDDSMFETDLAFAFRTDQLEQSDLEEIANFKRIVKNHQKMKRLLGEYEKE